MIAIAMLIVVSFIWRTPGGSFLPHQLLQNRYFTLLSFIYDIFLKLMDIPHSLSSNVA